MHTGPLSRLGIVSVITEAGKLVVKTLHEENRQVSVFVDVMFEEIRRPTGGVDVLIGYGHPGYHPVPEQMSGHLLLLTTDLEDVSAALTRT